MVRDNFNEEDDNLDIFGDAPDNAENAESEPSSEDTQVTNEENEVTEKENHEEVDLKLNTEKEVDDDYEDEKAKKTRKPFMKRFKIPIIVAACLVVLIAILVIKSKLGKSGENIYSTTKSILTNELGTFSYTIDVRTGEVGSLNKQNISSVDLNNLENVEIDGTETGNTEEGTTEKPVEQKTDKNSWTDASGIETEYWKYPNFKIQIKGTTMSVDPLETHVTVTLATDYNNDTFTEIIVKDGKYYINTEAMRKWLANSKDSHFMEIGKLIPENSTYAVLDEKDFAYVSRYAEIGEKNLATTNSLRELYVNTVLMVDTVMQQVRDDSAVKSGKDNTSTIEFTGDAGTKTAQAFKNVILNIDSMYDKYCSTIKSNYNKSDEDMQQLYREKDNIIKAFQDSQLLVGTVTPANTKMSVKGTSRQFTNGSGSQQMEAVWYIVYTMKDKDVQIGISLTRSGDKADIVAPTDAYELTDAEMPSNVINQCLDYMNPTSIKLGYQTEITPNSIANKVVDDFIQLVNDSDVYDKYLTKDNFIEYLEKYANYVEDDNTTRGDQINAQLVADFFTTLNSVTGGVIKEVEKQEEVNIPKYTQVANKILVDDKEIDVIAKVNEEETQANLVVIDLSLMYKVEVSEDAEADSDEVVDDSIEVNLSDFSLHTLLKSIYPANNTVLLNDYGVAKDKYSETVKVQPNIKGEYKLYVVVNTDEYMDLWFNNTNLGEIINH